MTDRPVFGQPLPPGPELWTCGWHPVCGHVRHIAVNREGHSDPLPGLVYGRLPAEEAQERLGDCPTCDPDVQPELGL